LIFDSRLLAAIQHPVADIGHTNKQVPAVPHPLSGGPHKKPEARGCRSQAFGTHTRKGNNMMAHRQSQSRSTIAMWGQSVIP
jgi:hypothetical protein